jgi:aryl-alcohol dehydrogenase-like predicted oxidoreductase
MVASTAAWSSGGSVGTVVVVLPLADFGATGHRSTRVIFGAAALGAMSEQRAATTLDEVRALGINHIDTAASYGDSEDRLQPWLRTHRNSVFLATKTGERTGPAARAELERSLERLGVEHVDMIQLHNLVEPDEWGIATGAGGAFDALAAARDEGLVSHIGVTGHGLRIAGMHLRTIERFDVASVLLPINFVLMEIASYRADVERLLAVCADRQIAVQTIKSIAKGRWGDESTGHFSWYEPLTDPEAIDRAVRYVLSDEQLFLNTSSDARLLAAVVDAASGTLDRPTDAELAADVREQGITALFDDGALERI